MIIEDEDQGLTPLQEGIAAAGTEDADAELTRKRMVEGQRVTKLLEMISDGRKFDEAAYAAMAKDRLYARGITGSKIKVNLIQSYIDTWTSILYARDPDVDVLPSEEVSQKGREDARLFAKTLEVVIHKLWKRGKVKRAGIKWVRAALSVGIGWLRVTWQQRTMQDPVIKSQMDDIQDNLKRLVAMKAEMAEGYVAEDAEAQQLEYEEAMEVLEQKVERIISRGMAFDFIRSEDVTVSNEVDSVMDYPDSPWVDIRFFKAFDTACAMFPDVPLDVMKSATLYSRVKQLPVGEAPKPGITKQAPEDADNFARQASDAVNNTDCSGMFVCIHELEHRDSGMDYTMIEGVPMYPRQPVARKPYATRFYTVFGLSFSETDGMRYPESLNTRSHTLQDEFTNLESRLATHRQRVIPKILFNKNKIANKGIKAITDAVTGEMVGVEVRGNIDLSKLLFVPAYPQVDMGLYDTSNITRSMEIVWGTQEAVMGSISVAKTATEAKIQEAGTGARTSSKRDELDDRLTEIAQYTGELAIQVLDAADVRGLAGAEALWPEINKPEDLDAFVQVQIRAGSSGKPDTAAEIEAWSQLMPMISQAIGDIAALRKSNPLDVADKLEALLEETVERFGDKIDITRLIPQVQGIDPATGLPIDQAAIAAAQGLVPGGEGAPAPTPDGLPAPAAPEGETMPPPGMAGPVGPANVNPMV